MLPKRAPGKGFSTELKMLTARSCGTPSETRPPPLRSLLPNLIFGLIFLGVGKSDKSDYDVQSNAGAITMVSISAMLRCTQPALLFFPSERPVFLREYASNMYGVIRYFFSKTGTSSARPSLSCGPRSPS